MSGIGSSLADLDKEVNKSVPGGWVTIGGLALGGAGAAGAFSGLGAGAAGASGAAGGAGAAGAAGAGGSIGGISAGGAFIPAAGSGASFAVPSAVSAASATGATANIFGAENPYMAKVIQAGGQNLGAEQSALLARQASGMGLEGAANAIGSSYQPGSFGSGAARAMYGGAGISPMQAMMANQALGGFGQQQPSGNTNVSAPFKAGQPVNLADPIATLLAPKRKKKEPISLL